MLTAVDVGNVLLFKRKGTGCSVAGPPDPSVAVTLRFSDPPSSVVRHVLVSGANMRMNRSALRKRDFSGAHSKSAYARKTIFVSMPAASSCSSNALSKSTYQSDGRLTAHPAHSQRLFHPSDSHTCSRSTSGWSR